MGEGVGCFGYAGRRSVVLGRGLKGNWRLYAESVYGNGITAKNEKMSGKM